MNTKINDGQTMEITCPVPKCATKMSDREVRLNWKAMHRVIHEQIKNLVNPKTYEKFEKFRLDKGLSLMEDVRFCPKPGAYNMRNFEIIMSIFDFLFFFCSRLRVGDGRRPGEPHDGVSGVQIQLLLQLQGGMVRRALFLCLMSFLLPGTRIPPASSTKSGKWRTRAPIRSTRSGYRRTPSSAPSARPSSRRTADAIVRSAVEGGGAASACPLNDA